MIVLFATQGKYGERIASFVAANRPEGWEILRLPLPRSLPMVIDDPDEVLPAALPAADLLVSLHESPGAAELIPDIARLCGCASVLAPVDRNEALPQGLVEQLRGWLEAIGVRSVFPRPLCTLGEETINRWPIVERYDDPLVREFARWFGQPKLALTVEDKVVTRVDVVRDSACGCARFVAEGLTGVRAEEAVESAGMLHHHFPCLASMNIDADYRDTLRHVAGSFLKEEVAQALAAYVPTQYLRPAGHVDET